jgi:adenylate cyclase
MSETRKLAAILCSDVVGYSRLAGADEDRILARLRALRSDLIDPTIAVHNGRIVKRTGDGSIVEFRSVVDAVRCAIELQNAMVERNAGVPEDRRIVFRIGVHIGDVVEESDGDLMGDGVNIAARLEGVAAPGAICLSEDAYRQVKGRLDLAVTDLGPTKLKNIAEPIRAYSLQVGVPAAAKPKLPAEPPAKPPEPKKRAAPAPLLLAIAALLVVIAAGVWYLLVANRMAVVATKPPAPVASNTVAPAEAAHLSLVVLPFTNLSGDASQDYFADGVTENLTTDLARIRDSFVIARNTAFTFKGKAVDAREIGRELGVRYVLEGSVQRDQGRVRVNVQLIDAQSGAHIWADRFEEDVADLFKLQDEVVGRLANTLGNELVKAEARGDKRIANLDAFDLTMRGRALSFEVARRPTKENNNAVRALYEQALAINPDDPGALAGDATTYLFDKVAGWTSADVDYDAKIVGQADRAIAIAPNDPNPYSTKSLYLSYVLHRTEEGLRAANAGLALNPGSALLYHASGSAKNLLGMFAEGKSDTLHAIQLSPRDPSLGIWQATLAASDIGLGHSDDAIIDSHRAIDAGYRPFVVYSNLAAACAMSNRIDDAKAAVAEALKLNPKYSLKLMSERYHKPPAVIEALRKAGVPEE